MKLASSFPLVVAAAVLLTLTACGEDQPDAAAPSSTPSVSATPTESTPTDQPTETGPVKRTEAELAKALLELKDLPSGFSEEKEDDEPAGQSSTFSAPTSKCKALVKYLNSDGEAPESKASAQRSFTGGQEGPYIDFSLDSLRTSAAVRELQTSYRQAVTDCKKVTMRTAGANSTQMEVSELTAPTFGESPFAFRLTGVSGPKQGLEYVAAITGIGDVLLSVGILAGQQGELDGATEAAVEKARTILAKTG
ncbi:hypothetical protein [Kribbella sp. CA-293567]|uniref:hypothetical protein n=1 Tax=Kribbella sp. CA-293567 TaxID=3002436 RepID=UPI0022DDA401|nr:hypothetical protein [Kribbella sp. CA-293567]WBQ03263.1 hypothetical protein OX958_25175 [Kribbella sp. CA-293567]